MTVSDDVRLRARHAATRAEQAVHTVAPWIEKLAHLGYAAKGLVYVAIGTLAIGVAAGAGGAVTDSRGVLTSLAHEPFGLVLVVLAALGFGGYAVWQAVAAIFDPERRGRGWKGAARRIGFAGSAVFHAGLALACIRLLVGAHRVASDRAQRTWTARVFALPFGTWIVAAVGAGIVVYGVYQLYVASRGKLDRRLRIELVEPDARRVLIALARFGIAARGVVFALAGVFVVKAAVDYDPSEVRTMRGTLRTLQHQPYGPWVLGFVAAGLIAYGGYLFAEARYRHIRAA